jgi:hypothetical protein
MADLGWLRFGQRSRTPAASKSPTYSEPASAHEIEEHRKQMPSRVSSYLSLNSRFSISPEPNTPNTIATNASNASNASFSANPNSTDMLVKEDDKVWHNPSLDQMVEALRVIMMTRGVSNPIPVEYNSYVLHLIEGFHYIQAKLEAANADRARSSEARSQASEDFRTVADEWQRRETQYKTEVKRLEVLLARTSRDGLETVTLARTSSVVDRGGPDPKQFVSRLKELRSQANQRNLTSQFNTDYEFPLSPSQSTSEDTDVAKALELIDNTNKMHIASQTKKTECEWYPIKEPLPPGRCLS